MAYFRINNKKDEINHFGLVGREKRAYIYEPGMIYNGEWLFSKRDGYGI